MNPLISIILPLYNAELFISDSVESMLQQTFADFELIIVNDGSTDRSAEIVNGFKDNRIILHNLPNGGMAAALNYGIRQARGKFIARQDADDISYPERLEKQLNFLQSNTNVALVGTRARVVDENRNEKSILNHPVDSQVIRLFLLFDNPFVHSSVMMRKEALDSTGDYNVHKHALIQDYDLWGRMAKNYEIANLPDTLLDYREVSSSISRKTTDYSKHVILQSAEIIHNFTGRNMVECKRLSCLYHSDFDNLHWPWHRRTSEVLELYDTACNAIAGKNLNPEAGIYEGTVSWRLEKKGFYFSVFGRSLKYLVKFYNRLNLR